MSANKYANLPDIVRVWGFWGSLSLSDALQDTAPDIYETEDVFPSSQPDVCPIVGVVKADD